MKRLLDVEQVGGLIHKTYSHLGDDNSEKITVQTFQDVGPHLRRAKQLSQQSGKNFRFKSLTPANLMNQVCYASAKLWGVSNMEAFREIMVGKSDRAQKALKMLSEGRDYRKFQAKNY